MLNQTLLLAHDNEIGWTDLRLIVNTMSELTIVGEAITRSQALQLATSQHPDVLFLGATIDGLSATTLLTTLRQGPCPHSIAVIFATHLDAIEIVALARLGVAGYFLWSEVPLPTLRQCLGALISGTVCIESCAVAAAFIAEDRPYIGTSNGGTQCSPREHVILLELAHGRTRTEIAEKLQLSPRTVTRSIEHLKTKLNAQDLFELAMYATLYGLIP